MDDLGSSHRAGEVMSGSAWDRIAADPQLARARQKLSAHEIQTIIRHVWAAEEEASGQPYRVNINGTAYEWGKPSIGHEDICRLAGEPVHASVTWSHKLRGRTISGMTSPGRVISAFDGMKIDCVVTGNA